MKLTSSFRCWLVSMLLLLAATAQAIDYRDVAGAVAGPFEENRIARLAASIGRGSGTLSAKDVKAIMNALKKNKAIPNEVSLEWQKLLRMAQSISYLQNSERYYPVGYEFESVHKKGISWEEWSEGSKEFEQMIAGTFGMTKSAVFEPESDDLYPTARIYDEEGRRWSLTTEHVHIDIMKGGYELGSPPVLRPAELEQIASFRTILGKHAMGQSNKMTGAHQTYFPFPIGSEKNIDTNLVGRVAANLQILHANYGTAIHDIMNVKRMGGAVDNFFFRPVVFDHYELLKELSDANPATIDAAWVKGLLFDKHIEKEFEVQVNALRRMEIYEDSDVKSAMKWAKADKAKFKTAWKYRDTQLKINLDPNSKAPVLLWESRIADYVADQPEKAMIKTVLDELLIDQAYTLAKAGKIAKLTVSPRNPGESELDYWSRLQTQSKMTPEAFLEDVGMKDQDVKRMLLGKSFVAKNPHMKVSEALSLAFEMEGWDENIVKVILPRSPELRARWRKMGTASRVRALEGLGFSFEGEFNQDQYRILATEFYFDHQKYPFGHPELHVEASGNWEVKSSGRGLTNQAELEAAVTKLGRNFDAFGLHLHGFMSEKMIKKISGENAETYGKFLELHSLAMNLQGYAEASTADAGHWLDSWSLDRYSPGEIAEVKGHLKGKQRIGSLAQKYHNIAFRPVDGGLDIEIRDIDDDVKYGLAQLKMQLDFVQKPSLPKKIAQDKPFFMGFKEHMDLGHDVRRFTLEEAVAAKYPVTAEQRKLLRLFQFEIYKPSMANYMYFKDFSAIDETPDDLLDLAYVKTNYENNVVLPLLNYSDQSFIKAPQLQLIEKEKGAFVDRVYKKLLEVQADKRYAFLGESDHFYDLCEYLERSKHPSKPNFGKLSGKVKELRRELLDDLTYSLRGEVVQFVKNTKVNEMIRKPLGDVHCSTFLKSAEPSSAVVDKAFNRTKVSRPKDN